MRRGEKKPFNHESTILLLLTKTIFLSFLVVKITKKKSLSVWQRSRKLRQVFHAYAACADPSRSAGHRQHRPERVRRLLLHEPSVPPSVPAQRGMRREQKTQKHGLSLTTGSFQTSRCQKTYIILYSILSTSYQYLWTEMTEESAAKC